LPGRSYPMPAALALGIAASFFFAFTFVLNRSMDLGGGSWVWSASLRFVYMAPLLAAILLIRGGGRMATVLASVRKNLIAWIVWSTTGFGIFYSGICLASAQGPSWLVAATWQLTIVAGALLTPLFGRLVVTAAGTRRQRQPLPHRQLAFSTLILAGVALVQFGEARNLPRTSALLGLGFVLVAAFAYPLGNRKMMELCGGELDTTQRVFGMTLCSLPFWFLVVAGGLVTKAPLGSGQAFQVLVVALFSGIVATLLFFKATELAFDDLHRLAGIESTQAGELVFTLAGGLLFFGDRSPSALGFLGLALVVAGMVANGLTAPNRGR